MKSISKSISTIAIIVIMIVFSSLTVFAESGYYDSTYSMKGGVYSQRTWDTNATPTFEVGTWSCYCEVDTTLTMYCEKKTWYGYSTCSSAEYSARIGETHSLSGNGSGTYRLYFRNPSGSLATGSIRISWSW